MVPALRFLLLRCYLLTLIFRIKGIIVQAGHLSFISIFDQEYHFTLYGILDTLDYFGTLDHQRAAIPKQTYQRLFTVI